MPNQLFVARLRACALFGVGIAAISSVMFAELGHASAATGTGPMLVVALPWGLGPDDIAQRAGGHVVGPTRAPLAVMAAGVTADKYREAGALVVLEPTSLSFLCAMEFAE